MASDREYMRSIQTTAPASIDVSPAAVDGTLDRRLDDEEGRERAVALRLEAARPGDHKGAVPGIPRRDDRRLSVVKPAAVVRRSSRLLRERQRSVCFLPANAGKGEWTAPGSRGLSFIPSRAARFGRPGLTVKPQAGCCENAISDRRRTGQRRAAR
jgi:hypothetical protein